MVQKKGEKADSKKDYQGPDIPASTYTYQAPNGETITYSLQTIPNGMTRIEAPNIKYGAPVEINAENISKFGLGDDIVTYYMDDKGNLSLQGADGKGSDIAEDSPEEFLMSFGEGGSGSYRKKPGETWTGLEGLHMSVQRVEVDGQNVGYFITHNAYKNLMSSDDAKKVGLYLGPDAINLNTLDKKTRDELAKPESQTEHVDTKIEYNLENDLVENYTSKPRGLSR